MIQDHSPVVVQDFKGIYNIDSFEDSVPSGYFIDEQNTITYGEEVKTRDGLALALTTSAITQWSVYRRQGESARIIALIGNDIWDLTTSQIILSVAGAKGFAINYYNNRAFISPHNGISGLPGHFVHIYNGSGVARKACGSPPVSGFTATISATAGIIEAGTRIYAWVFETESGFVTGPSVEQVLVHDGTKAVNFNNIPIGPIGTAKRRGLASRAIQEYNGNPLGYEMFFIPGANVPNNTVTSLLDVDFYDADLQLSADYTYDQLIEIPAVVFIVPYGQRMTYGGPDIDKNLVYISKPLEPESIHSSAGFIPYDPFETEGVKDATEFRDNFFVTKRNKTYTVRDNTFEPSTWKPVTLDGSIGADINGIARFFDATGSKIEFFCTASASGIYKFSGTYEEIPISRNIRGIWERYNDTYLNKGQIFFDQERLLFYVLVTLDSAVAPNCIIVGNYENGFAFDRIKWHLWNFTLFDPTSIGIDRGLNKETVFKVSGSTGNLYAQEENRKNDNGEAINHFIKFAQVGGSSNSIHHCGGIGFRINGIGTMGLDLFGQDNKDHDVLPPLPLIENTGQELFRHAHFQSEKIALRISLHSYDAYFKLRKLNVYTNVIFSSRPNIY
jgi:hypothetical protein